MDGRTGDFGAVGSVSGQHNHRLHPLLAELMMLLGVRSPIKLAHSILQYSRKSDPLGRIPPL